ncbi:hypothetical protein SK128_002071, partial [Halocaridina rubra]
MPISPRKGLKMTLFGKISGRHPPNPDAPPYALTKSTGCLLLTRNDFENLFSGPISSTNIDYLFRRTLFSCFVIGLGYRKIEELEDLWIAVQYQKLPSFIVGGNFETTTRVTVVESVALSHINYCTTVWRAITKTQINRTQKLINFATQVALGGIRKYDHITPVLNNLGWLQAENK